jgi:predicted Zn-ribbon and HTH transcriptional regulator
MHNKKTIRLAEIEGVDVLQLLETATFDSIVPCICINKGCEYTDNLEPDQRQGYCPECKTNTVQSCLVIEGMI